MKPKFAEAVGAAGFLVAVLVLAGYAVIFQSDVALGALIAVVAAGNGFFLRGKVIGTST